MVLARQQPLDRVANRAQAGYRAAVAGVREHSHEPILGDWARCPPIAAVIGEPVVSKLVVDVVGVEQRDEDVDIEQGPAVHTSSLRLFTRCMVGRGADPGRRGRSGTPLRTRADGPPCSALRTSSEMTRPAVVPRALASSFAAFMTSSSRSRVVRMRLSSVIT